MAIEFDEIFNLNIPFVQAEITKLVSTTGTVKQEYTAMIIGQKTSLGTAPADAIYDIFSKNEAASKFGKNSMLAKAVDGWFDNNKSVKLKVLALDDLAGGTLATGTLTIGGTATSAGTFSFYVDGSAYKIAVSIGDTSAEVATALDVLINSDSEALFTSSVTGSVITLSSVHKGTFGNTIKSKMNYNSDEVIPEGLTATVVQMSSGAGDPDLSTFVIPHLEENQYNLIAHPYSDNTNLLLIAGALADNFKATEMLDSFAVTGFEDTVTNMVTKADSVNSPFITILDTKNAFTNSLEFASRNIGYIADIAQSNPGAGYLNKTVVGVLALDQRIRTERNVLAGAGISTFKTNSSSVINEKTVTSYVKDSQGISDDAFKELRVMLTLSFVRYSFIVKMSQFQNYKLGGNDDIFGAGTKVITPKLYGENLTFVYEQLITDAVCENLADFESSLLTEKDGNRINSSFNVDIINVLEQQAMKINFQV